MSKFSKTCIVAIILAIVTVGTSVAQTPETRDRCHYSLGECEFCGSEICTYNEYLLFISSPTETVYLLESPVKHLVCRDCWEKLNPEYKEYMEHYDRVFTDRVRKNYEKIRKDNFRIRKERKIKELEKSLDKIQKQIKEIKKEN